MSEPTQQCLILDDDELQKQSLHIQWRKDDTRDINGLFNSTKTVSKFPGAFQTYKKDNTASVTIAKFPFIKTPNKIVAQKYTIDASGIVFTPDFIANHGVPLLRLPEYLKPAEDDCPAYAICTPPATD